MLGQYRGCLLSRLRFDSGGRRACRVGKCGGDGLCDSNAQPAKEFSGCNQTFYFKHCTYRFCGTILKQCV